MSIAHVVPRDAPSSLLQYTAVPLTSLHARHCAVCVCVVYVVSYLCVFLSFLFDDELALLRVAAMLAATTILAALTLRVLRHDGRSESDEWRMECGGDGL